MPVMANRHETKASAARGGTLLFLGSLVGRLMVYLALILLARFLPADEAGRLLLALTLVQGVVVVAAFGVDQGLFHFAPTLKETGQETRLAGMLQGATGWLLLCGAMVAALLLGLADSIAGLAGDPALAPALQAFAVFLPFLVLLRTQTAACQALSRVGAAVVTRNIVYPGLTFAGMALLLPRWPVAGTAAMTMGAAAAVAALVGWILLEERRSLLEVNLHERVRETRRLLRFSLPLMATALLGYLSLWADSLLVGFYLPPEEMALYGLVYRVSLFGVLLVEAFSGGLGPAAARALEMSPRDLQAVYVSTTRAGLTFFLPVLAATLCFPEAIIGTFGTPYLRTDGVTVLRLLMAGQAVNVVAGGAGMLLVVAGYRWLSLANGLAAAALTIGLSFLLVPRFGILGGAWSAAGAVASVNIARLVEVKRLLHVHPFSTRLFRPLLAATLSAAFGLVAAALVPLPGADWVGLALMALTYAALVLVPPRRAKSHPAGIPPRSENKKRPPGPADPRGPHG